MNHNEEAGYVIRLADEFLYSKFKNSIAKYVQGGHVQTTKHWRTGRAFTPNGLVK